MPHSKKKDFSVEDHSVVVVGAAQSGIAAAELLVDRGASVTITDLRARTDLPDSLRNDKVQLEFGEHRMETFVNADLVVMSPGVPPIQSVIQAARAAGVPVISEIELASRWMDGRIVAVTGTKGKSTTTVLVGQILAAAGFRTVVGGNIGPALSTQVGKSSPDVLHIVEVSSFQLELTDQFHPWIAVLLNLTPDHLDRHETTEAYAAAKSRVFMNQKASDWVVVNADDANAMSLARGSQGRQRPFSLNATIDNGVSVEGGTIVWNTAPSPATLVPVQAVQLTGRHLLADVLAAVTVATILDVSADIMTQVISEFKGLEHVLEPVAEINEIRFINDSKATNVDAAMKAIETMDAPSVVLLGGRLKAGDLRELRNAVADHAVAVITMGEAQSKIRQALADVVPVSDARDMGEAVRSAFALAPPGGAVLLSPACASFDMYQDYADRGRRFKEEVARLERDMRSNREQ